MPFKVSGKLQAAVKNVGRFFFHQLKPGLASDLAAHLNALFALKVLESVIRILAVDPIDLAWVRTGSLQLKLYSTYDLASHSTVSAFHSLKIYSAHEILLTYLMNGLNIYHYLSMKLLYVPLVIITDLPGALFVITNVNSC